MNSYTILNARLVAAPKSLKLGGKSFTELRVADNPMKRKDKNGKDLKGRFVTLKFWEFQAELAAKLSSGDVIVPTGELTIETFTDKTGAERDKDVMVVTRFIVSKSESFYTKTEAAPAEAPAEAPATDSDIPF